MVSLPMPQRMWDMGTGEVERQEAENGEYSPGWDPFREYIDENEGQNWWEMGALQSGKYGELGTNWYSCQLLVM